MFTILLICAFPQVSPSLISADRPPQVSKSLLPCGVKNCDCGCAEGGTCVCRPDGMKSRGIGLPWKAYRVAVVGELYPRWFVSNRLPPSSDGSELYRSQEDAQFRADLLNGVVDYRVWKGGLKKRANPNPGIVVKPVTFAPVFMPSFGGGFTGAACRGGG